MGRLVWPLAIFLAGCIGSPPSGGASGDVAVDSAQTDVAMADGGPADGGPVTLDGGRDMSADVADVLLDGSTSSDAGDDADTADATPARYRIPITVPAGSVAEQLDHFPLLLDFDIPDLPTGPVSTADVSFVDELGNALPHDIESHAAGALRVWVLLPAIAPGSDFTFDLDFEGRPNDPSDVWADYTAVWHFEAVDAADGFADGAPNGNSATPVGGPSTMTGVIGNAVDLGSDQWLVAEQSGAFDLQTFTISGWARIPSVTGTHSLVTRPYGISGLESYQIWVEPGGAGFELTSGSTFYQSGYLPFPENAWVHVAYTYDGTNMVWYIDGDRYSDAPSDSGDVYYESTNLYIGADVDNAVTDDYLVGQLDELRFSNVALSGRVWMPSDETSRIPGASTRSDSPRPTEEFIAPLRSRSVAVPVPARSLSETMRCS